MMADRHFDQVHVHCYCVTSCAATAHKDTVLVVARYYRVARAKVFVAR
jgi:hypothetical protein